MRSKLCYLKLGMLIDSQTDDVISVFEVEWLDTVSSAEYNPCPSCMVNNVPIREVLKIIPGVKSPVPMNEL